MFQALRARGRQWADRRIPRADWQEFSQRNIFILPTGAGVVFGVLLLIMLITGINYQNSLIYLLTFLLGAILVPYRCALALHQFAFDFGEVVTLVLLVILRGFLHLDALQHFS